MLAGCALRSPRPHLRPTTAEELLAGLTTRRMAVTSLRGRARLRAGLRGAWTREAILVRRPAAIRIDVFSPLGLALAVGVQRGVLWAYPPAAATRYEGAATPANLSRFLGAPLAVADVIDVLLGVPPARAASGPPELSTTDEGEYRVTVPLAGGSQTIWFAGETLTVRRAEERSGDVLTLRLAFDDYRDAFPHAIEIAAPTAAADARLVFETVEPNAVLDPALFAPPPAPRVLPLEDGEGPS